MISDKHVATIARDLLTDWESLSPYLGLSHAKKEEIRMSYPGEYRKQKQECLQEWTELKGNEATYGAFITAAEESKHQQLADGVRTMLGINVPHRPVNQSWWKCVCL